MAVIRINKTADYTVMSNAHFKEKEMSLKAKGLLSLMLSLPDSWDYSIAGLVAICKENESAIKSTLNELKEFGYLVVTKKMPNETQNGRIGYEYNIFEQPQQKQQKEKQGIENLSVEDQAVEDQGQLNTKQLNTKDINKLIDENFEKLWKMLKSTPYDRKSKVSKKRKKELYKMGEERTIKAIELYLKVQNPEYYYKRDNFLNEIIDNFLDKTEKDFDKPNQTQKDEYWNNERIEELKKQTVRNGGLIV